MLGISSADDKATPLWLRQFDERYDFPPTVPQICVAICSTPRSGSHWLCSLLHDTGQFGYPLEYLNPANFREWARRLGTTDPAMLFGEIKRRRTSPNGLFAIKIHHSHLSTFLAVEPAFDSYELIHVQRADKLAQAVSLSRASQTKAWISEMPEVGDAHYNWEQIFAKLRRILIDDAEWEAYFVATGRDPCRVKYEEAIGDPDRTLERIFAHCGRSYAGSASRADSFTPERQAGEQSRIWMSRFLAEAPTRIRAARAAPAKEKKTKPEGLVRRLRKSLWADIER